MNPGASDQQFEQIRALLLPILADAAVGRFEVDVPLTAEVSREAREVLAGVQVLLQVIREQQAALEQSEADLLHVQGQTTEILARILDRSLSEDMLRRSKR